MAGVQDRVIRIGALGDTQEHIGIHQTGVDHHLLLVLIETLAGEGFLGKLGNLVGELCKGIQPCTNFFRATEAPLHSTERGHVTPRAPGNSAQW
jgi:hypothetical protein